MNYYHNSIIVPSHINSNNEILENLSREKDECTKKCSSIPNSHQSIYEAFRNSNIISFFTQSLCYKRRNMNEDEIFLVNKCRKKILNEINSIISEIMKKNLNDFNQISFNPNAPLNKSITLYKNSIFILYSLTEFYEDSDIYSQYNPFEIAKLVFSKEYDIIKNICIIMKKMNINTLNSPYHILSSMYLVEVFKFIRINSRFKKARTILNNSNNNSNNSNEVQYSIELINENEDEEMENENEEIEENENEEIEENEEEMYYSETSSEELDEDYIEEYENNNNISNSEESSISENNQIINVLQDVMKNKMK